MIPNAHCGDLFYYADRSFIHCLPDFNNSYRAPRAVYQISPFELSAFPSQIRYWLLGVRFSLRYNLPSGWNATMKLQFFSGPSSSLVLCNNVSCLQILFTIMFLSSFPRQWVPYILTGYTDIQCTKYINNFAFKLFIFYSFSDALNFYVVSSTVLINTANIAFLIIWFIFQNFHFGLKFWVVLF